MNPRIEDLTAAVEQETSKRPEVLRLMTHPGVGPLRALAYMLIIGTPARFQRGKQIGKFIGKMQDAANGEARDFLTRDQSGRK
jgi:transposase